MCKKLSKSAAVPLLDPVAPTSQETPLVEGLPLTLSLIASALVNTGWPSIAPRSSVHCVTWTTWTVKV